MKLDREQVPRLALAVEDTVKASGLSRSTIYGLIAAGHLPSLKVAGRRLILADDLRRFLESHREGA